MLKFPALADRQQQIPVGSGSMRSIPKQRAGRNFLQQHLNAGGVLQPAEIDAGEGRVRQFGAAPLATASRRAECRDSTTAGRSASVGKGSRI